MARGVLNRDGMRTRLAVVAALSLAACTDPPSIVGDWTEVLAADDPGPRTTVTFRADGTYQGYDTARFSGTYTLDAAENLIVITHDLPQGGTSWGDLHSYAVTDTMLMLDAARPLDAADGPVATWRVEWTVDGDRTVLQLQVRADGSASSDEELYLDASLQPITSHEDGHWQALPDDQIEIRYDRLTVPRRYFVVDGYLAARRFARR